MRHTSKSASALPGSSHRNADKAFGIVVGLGSRNRMTMPEKQMQKRDNRCIDQELKAMVVSVW